MIEAFVSKVMEEQKNKKNRNSEINCAKQKSTIQSMCPVSLVYSLSTSRGNIALLPENDKRIIKNEIFHQDDDIHAPTWDIIVGSEVRKQY